MNDSIFDRADLYGQAGSVATAIDLLIARYDAGGKLMICGNGGSAADCEHIVGELMKGFCLPRAVTAEDRNRLAAIGADGETLAGKLQYGLPALSLVSHAALITAIANDIDGEMIFAQQVWGYGMPQDALLAISTSGNSANVLLAAQAARAKSIPVIGLTGRSGGRLANLCDIVIAVPSDDVARIQEMHMPVYHEICRRLEAHYFAGG